MDDYRVYQDLKRPHPGRIPSREENEKSGVKTDYPGHPVFLH
jgi:hypothetical protein